MKAYEKSQVVSLEAGFVAMEINGCIWRLGVRFGVSGCSKAGSGQVKVCGQVWHEGVGRMKGLF